MKEQMRPDRTGAFISHVSAAESARVLGELLRRHPDLKNEANAIAKDLMDHVSVEDVAEEVAFLASSIGLDDLGSRAGRHSWGYVEPGEAASELLEESIEDVRADMARRFNAGMTSGAEKVCQSIIIGLHGVDDADSDLILQWAPDFPANAAGDCLATLLRMYPPEERRPAGRRIVSAIQEHATSWVEMLNRIVPAELPGRR